MLICVAYAAAVFQAPRVIITAFRSDVGEKSHVVTPLGESISSCGTLKPSEFLSGEYIIVGSKTRDLVSVAGWTPISINEVKKAYIAEFLALAMTHF